VTKDRAHAEILLRTCCFTWKCFRYGVLMEKILKPPRRAKCPAFRSLILELAKGFEPLTL
jgi:hypothetical protein